MTYTTGLNFNVPNKYTPGLNFTVSGDNSSQLSSGTITLIGSSLTTTGGDSANSSQLSSGTITLIGQTLTSSAPEHNIGNLSSGTIALKGNTLRSAVSNLLGVDAYSVTIQGTRDLYYLSDSMSGYAVDYYPYHVSDISKDLVGLTLNVNNSRTEHNVGTLLGGGIDGSYLADFYNRIHLSTNRLSLGNVLSDQLIYVDIWNAFFVSNTITSIANINLTDVVLGTPFSVPSTFTPLQNSTMSVNVSTLGTPTIDGNFQFNFSAGYAVLYLDGQRVILWPFCPLANFTETRVWDTDVLSTRLGETRYALRDTPRTSVKYDFLLRTREEHSQAINMANALAQYPLGIPLWTDVTKLSSVAQGVSAIYFDTTNMEFVAGEPAVIYTAFNLFETVQVAAVYTDHITLTRPVKFNHGTCYIIPVHVGYINNGINFTDDANHSRKVSIDALIPVTYNVPAWPSTVTYLGIPVLPVTSIVSGGLSSRFTRKQDTVDSETGNLVVIDGETYNREYSTVSLLSTTKAERYALRRQFDYLKGKFNTFWLPSFTDDIIPLSDIPVSSNSLHVKAEILPLYYPDYVRLTGISGTTTQMIFKIATVTDNLDGTAYIQFTTIAAAELHSISKIEILKLVRLDTDTVEYTHHGKDITTVKAAVLEVKA